MIQKPCDVSRVGAAGLRTALVSAAPAVRRALYTCTHTGARAGLTGDPFLPPPANPRATQRIDDVEVCPPRSTPRYPDSQAPEVPCIKGRPLIDAQGDAARRRDCRRERCRAVAARPNSWGPCPYTKQSAYCVARSGPAVSSGVTVVEL